MKLEQVSYNWEALGERDALGAILTESRRGAGRWDNESFFETGRKEVDRLRARFEQLGLPLSGERALDFGCGVGRITRHLLEFFGEVDGIDVARSMLVQARELNPSSKLQFLFNQAANLDLVPDESYELVLSLITLQHMPPAYATRFIAEFFRKVRPGGAVFFQIPSQSHQSSAKLLGTHSLKQRLLTLLPPRLVESYRLWRNNRPRIDMFGLPREKVEGLVEQAGAQLLAVDDVKDAGELLPSLRYYCRARP